MKIVHVLTYVSADGAYGGPVAVARNQCESLAKQGHEVHLVAGWDGLTTVDIDGVLVHLHRVWKIPRMGFAGYFSPGVWNSVRRLSSQAQAVHFHFARDLVQVPAALHATLARRNVFLQTHGMVRPDKRVLARFLDALVVRAVYQRARHHLLLTQREIEELPLVARTRRLPMSRIRNAINVPTDVASWTNGPPTVLYLARLHKRKRPIAFVEMADILVRSGFVGRFHMFGPDEGEAASVEAAIHAYGLESKVKYKGALEPSEVAGVLADAQVYVLPSIDEPFPMSLLEALAAGLPSVITDQTGLSDELHSRGSAVVTSGTPSELADAVRSLLSSEVRWQEVSEQARRDAKTHFSSEALVSALETLYSDATRRIG